MEFLLFVLIFWSGYLSRGFLEHLSRETMLRAAEFLWFNPTSFQWERISRGSGVKPHSRILMGIPVDPSSIDLERIHEFQTDKLKEM